MTIVKILYWQCRENQFQRFYQKISEIENSAALVLSDQIDKQKKCLWKRGARVSGCVICLKIRIFVGSRLGKYRREDMYAFDSVLIWMCMYEA